MTKDSAVDQEGSVRKKVAEALGEEAVDAYNHAGRVHYRRWRWRRICDKHTLGTMRAILSASGCLTTLRNPEWRVDRSQKEVEAALGVDISARVLDWLFQNRLSGLTNPR